MRLLSWLGGILVAAVLGSAIGAVALVHVLQPNDHSTLIAARPAAATGNVRPLLPDYLPDDLPPAASPAPSSPHVLSWAGAPPPHTPPAVVASASIVVGSTQQALINSDRAGNGLGALTWSSCLYNVAVANARRIAAQGYLSHTNGPNVDLTCGLGYQAGENVGWYSGGVNDSWINSKFMASPEHYANIMGPYHYVATAWVTTSDGRGWIAVEFG